MASKYAKDFSVPKDFPSVLKAFTREVLRSQPENIYGFGASYFSDLVVQAEAAAKAQKVKRLSPNELEQVLRQTFMSADKDASGALSLAEFKEVLTMADLGLSEKEMQRILAEADVNDDGEITYAEFVPLAVDLVHAWYAQAETQTEEVEVREAAMTYMLHGMTKEEMEDMMFKVFQAADTDNSGALSRQEFLQCIKEADLGFTRKEINLLMHHVDLDEDGHISYAEFTPLCFNLLVDILKEELMKEKEPSELENFLVELWRSADVDGQGKLDAATMRDKLLLADLGLSRLQAHAVMAAASYDDDANVGYQQFAPKAADLVFRMLNSEMSKQREEAVKRLMDAGTDFTLVHGCDSTQMGEILMQAFGDADPDGAQVLPYVTIRTVLASCSLGLAEREVNALMGAVKFDSERLVPYAPLANYAFVILQHLARDDIIRGVQ